MSNKDSSLSKEQQKLLKQFKKQISNPHSSKIANQPESKKSQAESEELEDTHLFKQAVAGVKPINNSNIADVKTPRAKKVDAQTLAKRAAAEGGRDTEHAELSDTQAALNPVASQATLSYRIATLQHKVFEDLKAGKMRWFEAVDLHGCTIEQARDAVLQIIQMAKDENQNVIKIVHGKGPEAVLKTYVNGWLRQHRDVLAFVSAPENQGGTGAVLVLLKRAEKNPKFEQKNDPLGSFFLHQIPVIIEQLLQWQSLQVVSMKSLLSRSGKPNVVMFPKYNLAPAYVFQKWPFYSLSQSSQHKQMVLP
ncbi:Smr protein/MutS2 [Acinetobacter baumannii ABNIH2]|nr:Smr protein/MutS2 [Acinetobacter baumannii ABNIH2]